MRKLAITLLLLAIGFSANAEQLFRDNLAAYGSVSSGRTGVGVGVIRVYDTVNEQWLTATAGDAQWNFSSDVYAPYLLGNGASITALNANNVSAGTLAVARGGTGIASYATGDLLYASAATTIAKLAAAASGNVLLSGTAPSWGKVGLATHVSGTLPQANGGTGVTTDFTAGSVIFDTGSGFAQSNSNLYWDNSAKRLRVNTLSAYGALIVSDTSTPAFGDDVVVLRDAASTAGYLNFKSVADGDWALDVRATAITTNLRFDNSGAGACNVHVEDGLFRTDSGTDGSNGTATGAGDVYVEDDFEVDNHAAIERLSVGSETAPTNAGDLTVNNRFVPGAAATWNVTGNSQTLSVTSSVHYMTSFASAYTDTRLGDGTYTGQLLYIMGGVTLNSVTFAAASATSNIRVGTAGALTINNYDTAVLIWDANVSDWLEISRSNN